MDTLDYSSCFVIILRNHAFGLQAQVKKNRQCVCCFCVVVDVLRLCDCATFVLYVALSSSLFVSVCYEGIFCLGV